MISADDKKNDNTNEKEEEEEAEKNTHISFAYFLTRIFDLVKN